MVIFFAESDPNWYDTFFKVNCSNTVSNQEALTFRKEYIFKWSFLQNTLDCRQWQRIQSLRINWKCRQSSHLTEISNPALSQKSLILTGPGREGNQKNLKKLYLVRGNVGAKRNSFELLSFSLSSPWKTQHNQSRTCTTGTKITYLIQYLSLWICWILDKIFSKRYLIGLYL